jgi:uncharacterized protein YbjT (DUF2867 family)
VPSQRVLVTGATGYIGGRLVPSLVAAGYEVRVLVRDAGRLEGRPWRSLVDVAVGDVFDRESIRSALESVSTTYYLVHSMAGGSDFHEQDLRAARAFGQAAREAGVGRIIYLGGLGDPSTDLSQHLRSRQATGDALRESDVPVTEFRAAVVVGAGSISFEMVRYLTERVPIMVCPRWVFTRIQPVAIRDVLAFLTAAPGVPDSAGQIVEIGGVDVLTYGEMMLGYARARGLRRRIFAVPVLTPRLSAYWVHWITPIPASIAHPLIQGLRNEVIVRTDTAARLFPGIRPIGYDEAVRLALAQLDAGEIETAWSDAASSSRLGPTATTFTTTEGMIIERRERPVAAQADRVFATFRGIGGDRGWFYADWLWRVRGLLDRLVGGVGIRRGRRHPDELRVGDALDFWRVESLEDGRLVRLRAEMKVPGRAWLQFTTEPDGKGNTVLVQTAFFAPKGLLGLAYWYLLYPLHRLIFSGLCAAIAARAEGSSVGRVS